MYALPCISSTVNPSIIQPEKAAALYNNKGINYMKDGYHLSAITSFKIALGLNPNSAASSAIYSNLGKAYLKTGEPQMAQECFEAAILFSPMSLPYYKDLVKAYKAQDLLANKLATSSYNVEAYMKPLVTAFVHIELGNIREGKQILIDFANKEPSLIISKAIKDYLKMYPEDL